MSDEKDIQAPAPEPAKVETEKDDPKIEVSESDSLPDIRPSDPGGDEPAAAAGEGSIDVTVSGDNLPLVEPEAPAPPPVPIKTTSSLPPRTWPPRTIADLMSRKVITLPESEPIGELESWMKRFRFHHLPVVGDEMKLVGIITRTDLLHAMLGVGPDGKPVEKATAETRAGAIMNKNVVTAQPDAPLTTACRVMLHEKLGCLPVILEDRTLVGILTGTDFARLALEVLERFAAASEPRA